MLSPHELPRLAISVRQPWAWAIIHAGKDIENRSWHVYHPSRKDVPRIGRACIHAAQGMGKAEYEDAAETITTISGIACPLPHELVRGAIIGAVDIVEGCTHSNSPWYAGGYGIRLRNPVAIETPIRAEGQLGWFPWARSDKPLPELAKWMVPVQEGML